VSYFRAATSCDQSSGLGRVYNSAQELEDRKPFAILGKALVSLKGTFEVGFRYRSRPSKKLPNIYVCAL
jgi:hypothetical protein